MTGFLISLIVEVTAIAALVLTLRLRKKMALSACLFLIAFEVIGMLAAGWALVCYGAVIEMRRL